MRPRPAEHYAFAFSVVIPARVCAYLWRYVPLEAFARTNRGLDEEVDNVLQAIRMGELAWARSLSGIPKAEKELPDPAQSLSTSAAAIQLGMTARGVRRAIADGRLKAELVDGRWQINRDAIRHFKASTKI